MRLYSLLSWVLEYSEERYWPTLPHLTECQYKPIQHRRIFCWHAWTQKGGDWTAMNRSPCAAICRNISIVFQNVQNNFWEGVGTPERPSKKPFGGSNNYWTPHKVFAKQGHDAPRSPLVHINAKASCLWPINVILKRSAKRCTAE